MAIWRSLTGYFAHFIIQIGLISGLTNDLPEAADVECSERSLQVVALPPELYQHQHA